MKTITLTEDELRIICDALATAEESEERRFTETNSEEAERAEEVEAIRALAEKLGV